ncbi:transposase, partial [Megasphaera cerevisiae]
MSIITQTDKRSGITYAYETTYYWNKKKQQSRAKRTCVGKVDDNTGNIIPTRGRSKKKPIPVPTVVKHGTTPYMECKHLYYGATYLLEAVADTLGLTADLQSCFPNDYQQM